MVMEKLINLIPKFDGLTKKNDQAGSQEEKETSPGDQASKDRMYEKLEKEQFDEPGLKGHLKRNRVPYVLGVGSIAAFSFLKGCDGFGCGGPSNDNQKDPIDTGKSIVDTGKDDTSSQGFFVDSSIGKRNDTSGSDKYTIDTSFYSGKGSPEMDTVVLKKEKGTGAIIDTIYDSSDKQSSSGSIKDSQNKKDTVKNYKEKPSSNKNSPQESAQDKKSLEDSLGDTRKPKNKTDKKKDAEKEYKEEKEIDKKVVKKVPKDLEKKVDKIENGLDSLGKVHLKDEAYISSKINKFEYQLDKLKENQEEEISRNPKYKIEELTELKEQVDSLEKVVSQYKQSDSKSDRKPEKENSGTGLSKREDPGKDVKESNKETYWVPLIKFYDCANEQIVEGTNNIRQNQPSQYVINDASFVMYKGNVFDNKQAVPNPEWDPIVGGKPLENVIDTSEKKPDRQGFYKIGLKDVEKQEICVPTRNGQECKYEQYWGKFEANN